MSPPKILASATTLVATLSFVVLAVSPAGADIVDSIPGHGWAVDPATTAGGQAQLVAAPGTPPAGTGAVELTVQATTDRAWVSNSFAGLSPHTFSGLTASWATYVEAGANAQYAAPVLKFPSYQDASNTAGTFTTLNAEPYRLGTVAPGQWQTWTLNSSSTVWQSNQNDSFCTQSTPCTLADFVARYPNAQWIAVQLGVGSGVQGPVSGWIDALTLSVGGQTVHHDFELPNPGQPPPTPDPSGPRAPAAVAVRASPNHTG